MTQEARCISFCSFYFTSESSILSFIASLLRVTGGYPKKRKARMKLNEQQYTQRVGKLEASLKGEPHKKRPLLGNLGVEKGSQAPQSQGNELRLGSTRPVRSRLDYIEKVPDRIKNKESIERPKHTDITSVYNWSKFWDRPYRKFRESSVDSRLSCARRCPSEKGPPRHAHSFPRIETPSPLNLLTLSTKSELAMQHVMRSASFLRRLAYSGRLSFGRCRYFISFLFSNYSKTGAGSQHHPSTNASQHFTGPASVFRHRRGCPAKGDIELRSKLLKVHLH